MKKIYLLNLILFTCILLTSCASKEKVTYYNDADNFVSQNYDKIKTTLQPDDLLMIIVSAQEPEAAIPFNFMTNLSVVPTNQAGAGQQQQQLYLVDANGNIEFPVLGTVNVTNKTKEEVVQDLQSKISKYIINPIINLRIMNFKVIVQGEVNNPGIHTITSERLTITEALALSGDLTIYGKRDNVLLIREEKGQKVTHRLDLTKSEFLNSPFYYLKQNDVVYVEPNKTRRNASAVGPNSSIFISIASILVTIIALTVK